MKCLSYEVHLYKSSSKKSEAPLNGKVCPGAVRDFMEQLLQTPKLLLYQEHYTALRLGDW